MNIVRRQMESHLSHTRFEYAYGYSTHDEIHNFLPELLHDNVIVDEPRFHYFRHRMQQNFPCVYTYERYYAFLQSNGQIAVPPPPPIQTAMQSEPLVFTHSRLSPPTTSSLPLPRLIERVLDLDDTPQLFPFFFSQSFVQTFRILEDLDGLFDDIPVVATPYEIESASSLCDLDRVAADAVCAICQDRGEATPWRRLNCGHIYHMQCIDTWFSQKVVCPVCRADVRTLAGQSVSRTEGRS